MSWTTQKSTVGINEFHGKVIGFHFDESTKLTATKIQTWLLNARREKGLTMHFINSVQERHLILKKWNLKSVHEYRYLEHTKSYPIDGVDDAQGFHIVKEALDEVNVSKENQENTFSMLAAVLWLGNITLSMSDDENHVVPLIDKACLNYHKIGNGK